MKILYMTLDQKICLIHIVLINHPFEEIQCTIYFFVFSGVAIRLLFFLSFFEK